MVRFVNFIVLLLLLGSAFYAYSVKYTTILFSTEIDKIHRDIEKEQIEIGLLRAEWAHLTRPERLQALGERHLELQPLALSQIVRIMDLQDRPPPVRQSGAWRETPPDTQGGAFTPYSNAHSPSPNTALSPLLRTQSFAKMPSHPMSATKKRKSPLSHHPHKSAPSKSRTSPSSGEEPQLLPPASIPAQNTKSKPSPR